MFNLATKKNEFSESLRLKNKNTIMETSTISRFLERILCKGFHKVQDVVKQKQLKTIGRQEMAASDSSQS